MVRLAAIAAVAARRLPAPRSPHATLAPHSVTLRWSAPKHAHPARYVVLRDGRVVGRTTHRTFTDRHIAPGHTYRYRVVAVDRHGRRGRASAALRVRVPPKPLGGTAPTANSTPPIAPVAPVPVPAPGPMMTAAMVDRLFWRAGFGPAPDQREQWTGRPAAELVDWMLDTPPGYAPTGAPPLSDAAGSQNQPIDPAANDDELLMEWLYAMQTAVNPLPDRLAFFWHRHWAVSREDGSVQVPWILAYRDRLRRYADFSADPGLSFRALAWEMTTQDAAMSMYLNGNQNVKRSPNENYAREFQELFCLGTTAPDGTPNYTQTDVHELARAFTGWRLDTTAGTVAFQPASFDAGAKSLYGRVTIPDTSKGTQADQLAGVQAAVEAVLTHPSHAQFLVRKLWAEFIAGPIPPDALAGLVAAYTAGGALALRPLVRGILTHPLIFESLDEPNLVKPPVVYLVGLMRALGAPMKGSHMRVALGQHAAGRLQAAERRRLGGRPVLVQHEHRAGPVRRRGARAVPEVLDLLPRARRRWPTPVRRPPRTPSTPPTPRSAALAVRRHARLPHRLGRHRAGRHPQSPPPARLHPAGAHPRRPRRAGELDALHRVRGDRARPGLRRPPDADAARAQRGAGRLPGGPRAGRAHAAAGCCSGAWPGWRPSTRRASSAGTRCGSRSPRRPRPRRRAACSCSTWPAATTA